MPGFVQGLSEKPPRAGYGAPPRSTATPMGVKARVENAYQAALARRAKNKKSTLQQQLFNRGIKSSKQIGGTGVANELAGAIDDSESLGFGRVGSSDEMTAGDESGSAPLKSRLSFGQVQDIALAAQKLDFLEQQKSDRWLAPPGQARGYTARRSRQQQNPGPPPELGVVNGVVGRLGGDSAVGKHEISDETLRFYGLPVEGDGRQAAYDQAIGNAQSPHGNVRPNYGGAHAQAIRGGSAYRTLAATTGGGRPARTPDSPYTLGDNVMLKRQTAYRRDNPVAAAPSAQGGGAQRSRFLAGDATGIPGFGEVSESLTPAQKEILGGMGFDHRLWGKYATDRPNRKYTTTGDVTSAPFPSFKGKNELIPWMRGTSRGLDVRMKKQQTKRVQKNLRQRLRDGGMAEEDLPKEGGLRAALNQQRTTQKQRRDASRRGFFEGRQELRGTSSPQKPPPGAAPFKINIPSAEDAANAGDSRVHLAFKQLVEDPDPSKWPSVEAGVASASEENLTTGQLVETIEAELNTHGGLWGGLSGEDLALSNQRIEYWEKILSSYPGITPKRLEAARDRIDDKRHRRQGNMFSQDPASAKKENDGKRTSPKTTKSFMERMNSIGGLHWPWE